MILSKSYSSMLDNCPNHQNRHQKLKNRPNSKKGKYFGIYRHL